MHHLMIVFLLLLGLGASTLVSTSRTDEQVELQNSINCESVCGDCRCRGFYCGEECICECNGDNEDDNKCLTTMHNKCKKLRFPFEVLIQGPSGNRFMRSASLFEDLYEEALKSDTTKKRRTIVLYRPEPKRNRRDLEDCDSEEQSKVEKLVEKGTGVVSDVRDTARKAVSDVEQAAKEFVATVSNAARDAASTVTGAAKDAATTVSDAARDAVANVTDTVRDRASKITPIAQNVVSNLKGADDEQQPEAAAAEEDSATVDPPIVGLPLALAIPAARARTRLSLAAIKAQYDAALSRLRTSLALSQPILPGLPVQPLFTL